MIPACASPPQTPPYETGVIYGRRPAPHFQPCGIWVGDPEQAHRKDSFWRGLMRWEAPARDFPRSMFDGVAPEDMRVVEWPKL